MSIVACDIGGTMIKGARFTNGIPGIQRSLRNDQTDGKTSTMRVLFDLIDELMDSTVTAIGIVTAGAVNPHTGMIVGNTGTLQGWVGFSISDTIQSKYGVPCYVDNDANGAMVAEMETYLQQGIDHAVMLTLGTGVGSGVFIHKSLYYGSHYQVELGHTILHHNGLLCTCGQHGCAEQYVSGRALTKRAQAEVNPAIIHGKELFDEIRQHNTRAIDCLNRFLDDLLLLLHNFYRTYDPQLFLIGGGVSDEKELFMFYLQQKRKQAQFDTPVELATYGNFAGIQGAYLIAVKGETHEKT